MHALRIFTQDSEHHTLRMAFEEHLRPKLLRLNRKASHVAEFETTLRRWDVLTSNPAVSLIDDATFQGFADGLLEYHQAAGRDGHAAVAKAIRYVRSILRAIAKREPSNPRGLDGGKHLIDSVPVADLPGGSRKRQKRRTASVEEISAAFNQCEHVRWPRSRNRFLWDRAPVLWRLLFMLVTTYGPRRGDLLGLRWECFQWEPECPAPDISRLEWPWGWLIYTPEKTGRHKPDPLHLPITKPLRLYLESIRPRRAHGPIFDFPNNKRALYREIKRTFALAGIEPGYTFQELRKTASTAWNDLFPGLGLHVTGHAPRGVNAVYYDQELRRLCRFAPKLEQPPAFLAAAGLDPESAPSARAQLAERLDSLTEDKAALLLKLADQMA